MKTVALATVYEEQLKTQEIPYPEYPRPRLRRSSFKNLNGLWDFKIENKGEITYQDKILVPFVPESRISGAERTINKGDALIYQRSFFIEDEFINQITLLHFGACDQLARVYINGTLAGENVGGYLPFSFDISELIHRGENIIRVVARDDMDIDIPYGKQTAKRGGMWYTKISGIWQTVWLESLPRNYISDIKLTPDLNGVSIKVFGGEQEKKLVFDQREYSFVGDRFYLKVENPRHWTPETPFLYDFSLISGEDRVDSYFALRTVTIEEFDGERLIALNQKPYYFHGVLDQGYYSDGIFLPATAKGYEDDILTMKKCGFNMLRKHIKLEPSLFYYYCDKYGMAVFQDFINNGKYSFVFDTALPTVGIKKRLRFKPSSFRKEQFLNTSMGISDCLYNHPSVIYYTIFNEGWGQHEGNKYYEIFKSNDPTRIYDTASGWFRCKNTDVESPHVYFKPVKLKKSKAKPIVLSEFGGYSCKIEGHSFNLDKNYGYRTFKSPEELEQGINELYEKEIVPAISNSNLCGDVLTQLSDVEDETNGLVTYDRRVIKIPCDSLAEIGERLKTVFEKKYR